MTYKRTGRPNGRPPGIHTPVKVSRQARRMIRKSDAVKKEIAQAFGVSTRTVRRIQNVETDDRD